MAPLTYNTLDIDSGDRYAFEHIILKLTQCRHLQNFRWVDTQKGYHVRLWCRTPCDICRMVYDDQKRFAIDYKRPKAKQNVLFAPFSAHKVKKFE